MPPRVGFGKGSGAVATKAGVVSAKAAKGAGSSKGKGAGGNWGGCGVPWSENSEDLWLSYVELEDGRMDKGLILEECFCFSLTLKVTSLLEKLY